MEGKVLRTSLDSIPLRKGVYFFGSKVSVCAIPPAIKSRITESAVEGKVGVPQEESNPAKGAPIPMVAMAAALVFFMKSRRLWRVFIGAFILDSCECGHSQGRLLFNQ